MLSLSFGIHVYTPKEHNESSGYGRWIRHTDTTVDALDSKADVAYYEPSDDGTYYH